MKVFIHKGDATPVAATVDISSKLGRGATATIYRITYAGESCAAKIYHKASTLNAEKVLAMLANVPANAQVNLNGKKYPQYAWPIALIKDNQGAGIGYVMPLVDPRDSYTLDHYYDQVLLKKLNRPNEAALNYKLEVAIHLSELVAELHKHQHYFIDFKPQNIRVFRETHLVTLIDCDGFSILGKSNRFPAEMLSSDYIAPEVYRLNKAPQELSEPQDRYALAVILFQLLNRGTHPFQGIVTASNISANTNDEKAAAGLYPHGLVADSRIKPRPQSTHHLWDAKTRALFDQAFTTGSPTARPSAQEWADHFKDLLESKTLVRCQREPANLEHIRFRDMGCPACYLQGLPAFKPPVQRENRIQQSQPSTPQWSPSPAPAPVPDDGWKGWWVIVVLAVVFLFWFANNKGDGTTTQPRVEPAAPIPQVTESPIAQPQVSELSFAEKMDILSNQRKDKTISEISFSSFDNNWAREKYIQVVDEIYTDIKKLGTPISVDGQTVYTGFTLQNISGITLNGHSGENCGSTDIGRIGYCLVNRDVTPATLTCQFSETTEPYKTKCIETIER
jgi:serine/threonine protein kinase